MRVLIVALLLVCIGVGGAAAPSEELGVAITPESPTSLDPIVVTVSNAMPNTCWQLERSRVQLDWKKRKVVINLKYAKQPGGCLEVVVDKEQPVNLPLLAPGEWDVRIKVKRGKKVVTDVTCPITVGQPF